MSVRALVRDVGRAEPLEELGVELVEGDITEDQWISSGMMQGCHAVVHLVGIIREDPPDVTFEAVHVRGTSNTVQAARASGVSKFVHMSALGARPDGTDYERTKHAAEQAVRASGLPYVVFRPSTIIGAGGEFFELIGKALRLSPVMPVVGDGNYRLQPVHVRDVAEAFVQAVERDDLRDRVLELGGPHKLTFNRILDIVGEERGTRRPKLHLPTGLVRPFVGAVSKLRLPTPITSDEMEMLLGENVVAGSGNALRDVFGIDPTSLRTALQELEGRP